MKVLITSFTYPPNKDGVSEAARSMAEGLVNSGHSVAVATSSIIGSPSEENCKGARVYRFELSNNFTNGIQSARERERFIRFLASENADIVIDHCWDAWPAMLAFQNNLRISSRRVMLSHGYSRHILHPHGTFPFGLGVWLRGLVWTISFMPSMIRTYQCVIFLSDYGGFGRFLDYTLARWLRHPNIQLIPNSTSIEPLRESANVFRKSHSIGDGPMFLCVANYSERKNQELAVRAFYRASINDSTLVFIGSEFNEYSARVMSLAASFAQTHSSCKVLFLERIDRGDTLRAFSDADIFLLTAKAETQPIVLIESMAAGKPWISTPTGCVKAMEGGVTARSVGGLSSAIKMLVSNKQKAAALGREGRRAAEAKYRSEHVLQQWNQLIESLR